MEATLQKSKPKKHRQKSKVPPSEVLTAIENKQQNCDSSVTNSKEEIILGDLDIRQNEPTRVCNSEIELSSVVETPCVSQVNADNCKIDVHSSAIVVSNTSKQNETSNICDKTDSSDTIEIPQTVSLATDNTAKINLTSPRTSEKLLLKNNKEVGVTELYPLVRYPDLKCLQHCEKINNIVSSQTLVETFTHKYMVKVTVKANKVFEAFIQDICNLESHPMTDLIHSYHRAKKSFSQCHSRIKYLNSNLKRKKDSLWKTVKKEVSAKGKCADGYTVNIKNTYYIKELDEIKFNEVIKNLKEIEESLLSAAFHSYSEELLRLRIEHYMYNLIQENVTPEITLKGVPVKMPTPQSEAEIEKLKKCISVLFDSQRQNVEDKHYLDTCQNWLKMLVSNLNGSSDYENNLFFLLNHVIRCPNGIRDWASQLVQVPINNCEKSRERNEVFECCCAERILLTLFLILTPVPFKDHFLRNIKNATLGDPIDGKFTVIDSDGEEEEILEMSKNWSDGDIISLLNQIPVRSLFKHLLLDAEDKSEKTLKVVSEDNVLKLFAFSTSVIDILCIGLENYHSENYPLFFESISNLIRHILLYISEYCTYYGNMNIESKSEIQAVYDKFFFHVIYKIYNFRKLHVLKILPALPYNHVSVNMLWNILWIFFHPGKKEEFLYSEKDVEVKIKDDCVQSHFINHIKNFPTEDTIHLLNAVEKIIISSNEKKERVDIIKFSTYLLFKITVLEAELRKPYLNEGAILLSSVCEMYPYLVTILLQEIHKEDNEVAQLSINLLKKINLSKWTPEDSDMNIISSWLLSSIKGERNRLARLILKKMNFEFNEEDSLFLPYELHQKIALLITEAYLLFDANNSEEGLISKGVKQMLQFTYLGYYEDEREDFAHFAWNILFSLKLHPLDKKNPPLLQVYEGSIEECDKNYLISDLQPLQSAYENKHPAGCYLMIIMTKEGYNMKTLLKTGLECLQSLVESEQYMAAIKLLYYLLPFFVKHSEDLLDKFGFLKSMHSLITADLTLISNITREPVIGAVLHKIAAMMKYQIYKAGERIIEFSAPILKLWINILMKMLHPVDKNSAYMLKNSSKQIHFLLDLLVKISFLHDYTRTCTLDLLDSYCSPHLMLKTTQPSILKRLFSSDYSVYPILNQNTLPEYPWLAWYVLLAEMKQKIVQDHWLRVQKEMVRQNESSPITCLKKASDTLKVDIEFLPIYRWALQAVETPVSHPVAPLIYQQFFLYYFHKVQLPNSDNSIIIGNKYFKNGQFLPLLKRMKKHIVESINYYKSLIKLPNEEPEHNQITNSLKKSNCENGFNFHLNLLKLYEAFYLWIDDESLQNSVLCLSALEPKYCPDYLNLILHGDQNVWIKLVSVVTLKEEIDQKVHPYSITKLVNDVKELHSLNQESLPKQLMRHLKDYEAVLPSVDVEHCVASPAAYQENCSALSFSKEAILEFIEQNQFIIFDKSKFFCQQMEKLKQLNFNFINLTPQEYKVEPCEIKDMKFCYKGENGCTGAAYFKLQIEKYSRNERIAERIDNNRADYLIAHDQLTKLPLRDLCLASLKIQNFIRSLARKMRQAENGNAEYFRKMGISLFYLQVSVIDKILPSVADYPPSHQFFSSIIESLGEEFINGEESELTELAKCILKCPSSGKLASPLFKPNKSSVLNFSSVYETLTSSITQESANTIFALFSKIDISLWLNENAPNFESRVKIFKSISRGLILCGPHPAMELLPLFEIIKKHFRIVLQYMFPDLFLEAVHLLINGAEDQNLSTDIFYEAFHCFGCPLFDNKTSIEDIEPILKKIAEKQHLPADQQILISVAQLNLQQVKQVSSILYHHFMQKRLLKGEMFYKDYTSYVKPIGIFLAVICHSLISLHLDVVSSLNQNICLSDLWDIFHYPFLAWIHPILNSSGLGFPWTNEELDLTCYMFKIYSICLKYFHEKILSYGCDESVLSYWWNFYIEIYVVPGYRHYSVSVCHTELLNLPWHQFHPCTKDIEGMCKVLQSNLPESKDFLSNISLKIPWTDVMQNISMTKSPDYVAKVLATLGRLLIISQLQCPKETESDTCTDIFKEFESLSWHSLFMDDVEALLNLYYDKIDFILLLNNFHDCAEFYVLKFLKVICCIVSSPDAKEYLNSKRVLYLQKFLSTISSCYIQKKDEMEKLVKSLKEILCGLLNEVDDVISNSVNPSEQTNYALPLMKEFVTFLNNLPGGQLGVAVVESLISYLRANKHSPLLLPCLKVSSSDLHSVSHMVPLIECCISTRFIDESPDIYETQTRWQLISSFFCVPLRVSEDFVKKCIQENAYLTLYCCVLHKLPHCDTTEKKKEMLQRIVQWVRESKLSPNAEAKFLLLWDRLLELSIMLVSEQEFQVVKQELMSFTWVLETLAEDRSSSGFFAVIGFGQASSLSVNFRFLCRVMAAFIQHQMPDNCPIRMEPTHVGLSASQLNTVNATESKSSNVHDPAASTSALRALDSLKALEQKKLYSALQSQISYGVQCITNGKYTLMQSRELLKYFALILYPKDSYLAALNS